MHLAALAGISEGWHAAVGRGLGRVVLVGTLAYGCWHILEGRCSMEAGGACARCAVGVCAGQFVAQPSEIFGDHTAQPSAWSCSWDSRASRVVLLPWSRVDRQAPSGKDGPGVSRWVPGDSNTRSCRQAGTAARYEAPYPHPPPHTDHTEHTTHLPTTVLPAGCSPNLLYAYDVCFKRQRSLRCRCSARQYHPHTPGHLPPNRGRPRSRATPSQLQPPPARCTVCRSPAAYVTSTSCRNA